MGTSVEHQNIFIESQNIEKFSEQLKAETEPAKRAILQKLLANEQAKRASHVTKDVE